MASKPTTDDTKAALNTVLHWFTVMADGTARPVVTTATGRVDSEDSANSPARLAWRCNGVRLPLAGMLAALRHGWGGGPKTWPVLRDVTPDALVAEGCKLYGLDSYHPAASWDAVWDQSDRALITALYLAVRAEAPFDVIAEVLTPTEAEKAPKFATEERELIKAVMALSEDNPARTTLMDRLSDAGRNEVARRMEAKRAKAERRKAAAPETAPEAKPAAKPGKSGK